MCVAPTRSKASALLVSCCSTSLRREPRSWMFRRKISMPWLSPIMAENLPPISDCLLEYVGILDFCCGFWFQTQWKNDPSHLDTTVQVSNHFGSRKIQTYVGMQKQQNQEWVADENSRKKCQFWQRKYFPLDNVKGRGNHRVDPDRAKPKRVKIILGVKHGETGKRLFACTMKVYSTKNQHHNLTHTRTH